MTSRLTALLFCVALLTSAVNAQGRWGNNRQITASDNVETQTRNVDGFSEIKVCCSIEVDVHQSNTFRVEVEAADNILQYIVTEVRGSRLHIGFEDNINIRNNSKVRVTVHMPRLEEVSASSSSKLLGQSTFRGGNLRLECSSSAKINLDFEGERVNADVSSSGRIELEGSADRLRVNSSSGSSVHAFDLATQNVDAHASSGSNIRVHASSSLDARASSGATVKYRGNPSNRDTDSSSGGRVRQDN
ncbi:MAG: head GIN domain-containing protein [Bacteroidota bacterium]